MIKLQCNYAYISNEYAGLPRPINASPRTYTGTAVAGQQFEGKWSASASALGLSHAPYCYASYALNNVVFTNITKPRGLASLSSVEVPHTLTAYTHKHTHTHARASPPPPLADTASRPCVPPAKHIHSYPNVELVQFVANNPKLNSGSQATRRELWADTAGLHLLK